jgi:hypothetical protein
MVMTKRDICKSKVVVENNPKTHNSSSLNFLGWQKTSLRTAK